MAFMEAEKLENIAINLMQADLNYAIGFAFGRPAEKLSLIINPLQADLNYAIGFAFGRPAEKLDIVIDDSGS